MANIFDCDSVHAYLTTELDRRKSRNANYSMRAYARDLGLSASRLSEILKGTAGMSEAMAIQVATSLKLKPVEKKHWLDLVLAKNGRNKGIKSLAQDRVLKAKKISRLKEIKENEFQVIADWYHAAILELCEVENFQSDAGWIANQLGISLENTQSAILRLKKLGLLTESNGQLTAQPEAYQAFSEVPSLAVQKFHQQMLTKCMDSIQNDSVADRLMQSMIVAVPKSQLPLFDQKLKAFLQGFWEDLKDTPKDQVYVLSLQMAPVQNRFAREKKPKP